MLRPFLAFAALLGLTACAEPTWAPQDQVDAARFVGEPPTSVTLYTVMNKQSGAGAHSAILVNASERVIFDPAGTWRHPRVPERNDVHFGMTDKAVAFYVDYHARETYNVVEQTIEVSPEVAELLLEKVKAEGPVAKSFCTSATSSILKSTPGFESLPATMFPKPLSEAFGELPGVTMKTITDDDDDSNHGVLLVQANGDPVEG
jgi:hypothetical protein